MTDSVQAKPRGAEPVLLLHCSASSGRQWEGLARSLDDRYRAVAPDLYGYGESGPWTGPGPLTLAAEAALAAAALPAGAQSVHVVGHSYGGAVALRFALAQAWRVRSLTLIEPVAFHTLRKGVSRDRRLLGSVQRVAAGMIEGVLSGNYHGAMQRFVDYWNGGGAWRRTAPEKRRQFSRHAPKVVLDFHAAMTEDTPLDAYRTNFPFPVRIMRGACSPAPTRRIAELLSEKIPGCRLETLAGAGHMLPMSHPVETQARIRGQLETVPEPDKRAA